VFQSSGVPIGTLMQDIAQVIQTGRLTTLTAALLAVTNAAEKPAA
jgi:hypothetical protein